MLFPTQNMIIKNVNFNSDYGLLSIIIQLEISEFFDGNEIRSEKTSIVLPEIDLGKQNAEELEGKLLSFPINPTDGYIDGSIYIDNRHHPIDVTKIQFLDFIEDNLRANISTNIALSFEGLGEYQDTPWTFELSFPNSVLNK